MLVLTVNVKQHFSNLFEHGHRYRDVIYAASAPSTGVYALGLIAHPQSPGYQISL